MTDKLKIIGRAVDVCQYKSQLNAIKSIFVEAEHMPEVTWGQIVKAIEQVVSSYANDEQ